MSENVKKHTLSGECNLFKIVVFPALSNPSIKIRTSFDPKSAESARENNKPMDTDKPEKSKKKSAYSLKTWFY